MAKFYLYLDQRDLINLARGRDDTLKARLDQEIASGNVQIVLSLMHAIETWKYADPKAKLNLAAYADSLSPIWLLFRSALFREEMLRAFYLFRGEGVVTLIDATRQHVNVSYPSSVGKHRVFTPFRKSVFETLSPNSVVSDPKSYANSFAQILTFFDEDPLIVTNVKDLHNCYPDWSVDSKTKIAADLPGKAKWLFGIARSALGLLKIEYDEIVSFVRDLDVAICPSICVYLRIKDAINRDKAPTPHPSEMVDIVHVSAIPYCDAFSTDKRIWDYVRRCKITKQLFPDGYARSAFPFKSLAGAMSFIGETHLAATEW